MDYQTFLEVMERKVAGQLQKEGIPVQIGIDEIIKTNNTKKKALTIRKEGSAFGVTIYMEERYEQYRNGVDLDVIVRDVCASYRDSSKEIEGTVATMPIDFMDIESVKDKIILRLLNADHNKEYLKGCPFRTYLDLVSMLAILVEQTDSGIASTKVTDDFVAAWGIPLDDLYDLAIENTKRLFPPAVISLAEQMAAIQGMDMATDLDVDELDEDLPFYIITNQKGINGAVTILYDKVLQNLANDLDANLYILPSSIHEVIAVPDDGTPPDMLKSMVLTVNGDPYAINETEILSNHVYYYDRKLDAMKIA